MIITRKSPISGQVHEMDINVTNVELARWKKGELIQRAMPHLTSDEREFIMTGIHPQEWKEMFN